ncbi:MAG: hypothetical protein ABSC11_00900 [Smithella sp.]|jgi:hypothetical protein
MNRFYYIQVDRRDFGDLISEENILRLHMETVSEIDFIRSPVKDEIIAVWSLNPHETDQLPEVLICKDGTQNDWAAWITTFAAKIRPFSAYMRLVTYTEFLQTIGRAPAPYNEQFIWPTTGLILGEALGASGLPDKVLGTLSATAFLSTLTFVMFRTATLYPDYQEWSHLVEMWKSVREITKQKTRTINELSIARIFMIVMNAMGTTSAYKNLTQNDAEVSEACRYILRMTPHNITNVLDNKIFSTTENMMYGSREDRVRAFEEFVRRIDNISVPNAEVMSFMLGYLASRIAPGTIKHTSMLYPVSNRYPTAILWYGFCAGVIEGESSLLRNNERHNVDFPLSARRVIRELFRAESMWGFPVCDIGYLELMALSRTDGDPLDGLIRTTQGSVIVELLPGVCTSINVSSKPLINPQERELHDSEIIDIMGKQIESLRETYKKLNNSDSINRNVVQPSLFPKRNKKK